MNAFYRPPVAAGNVEQARCWDGDEGDLWTEQEERFNAAIHRYGAPLAAAARITPTDRILDIGCGTGLTTRAAAREAAHGSALGVDLSARMIGRARERAAQEGLTNITFEQADAQIHPFVPQSFDIAISRFGAMFFGDPRAAFANIAGALRPGGRLVLLAWQRLDRNEWLTAIRAALAAGRVSPAVAAPPAAGAPGPLGLADPELVGPILTDAGFVHVGFDAVEEPFDVGADADEALRFLSGTGAAKGMLGGLADADRAEALERLRAVIAAHSSAEGILFDSSAWLITARTPPSAAERSRTGGGR